MGASSTPDRYLDFLQLGGTLMAVLWGRRGGRSDSAWLARNRGSTGPRTTTALTRHGRHANDTVGPTWAPHPSDRTQMRRLEQSTPHHFRRRGRRWAIRRPMAGAAAINCVSVMPVRFDLRLALKRMGRIAPGGFAAPVRAGSRKVVRDEILVTAGWVKRVPSVNWARASSSGEPFGRG
jgi:hypothetical protein